MEGGVLVGSNFCLRNLLYNIKIFFFYVGKYTYYVDVSNCPLVSVKL